VLPSGGSDVMPFILQIPGSRPESNQFLLDHFVRHRPNLSKNGPQI
jgi:hypothetical protein